MKRDRIFGPRLNQMNSRFQRLVWFGCGLWLALTGCLTTDPTAEAHPPEPVSLTLYNWFGYVPQDVLDEFEAETGITIVYQAYENHEEAVTNIRAGQNYDVVNLGNDFIPQLAADGFLAEIDYQNVPNFKNISLEFRDLAYDPENRYSIPYYWGTTGLLVHRDRVDFEIKCWADLWDPRIKGKVALWNIPRTTLEISLKSLGYPANTEDPAALEKALEHLQALEPRILLWPGTESTIVPPLIEGKAVVGYGWAYDAVLARQQNLPIDYILPCEGTLLWGENWVIPATSSHQAEAEQFLNYLLRPEVSARLIEALSYALPNEKVQEILPAELRNDPLIFPPAETLKHAEISLPLSAEGVKRYREIWDRFMQTHEDQ